MIKKSICIAILAFCCACQTFAEIKKIYSFDDAKNVLEKATAKTVVVFDVDETLLLKEWPLLHDRNSEKDVVKNFLEDPLYQCKISHDEMKKIIFEAPEKLIEPDIVKIIKNFQEKNIFVIALTSRATGDCGLLKSLEEKLYQILKKFDIDFSASFPIKDPFVFDGDLLFYKGIGFVPRKINGEEKKDKGIVLMKLLEKANIVPEHIIFFDDNYLNLKKVNEAIMLYNKNQKNNIDIQFSGFLYYGVEILPDDFDEDVVKFQINTLCSAGVLFGEKEAKKLFEEKEKKDESQLFYNDDDSEDSDKSYTSEDLDKEFKKLYL